MKLKPNPALAIPYDAPDTGVMQVRVAASDSINVYALRREALDQYKRMKNAPAVSASPVAKTHDLFVQLPPGAPWNLIIENPWEHEVEVNYAVTALAPSKPVVISGAVVTSPATVSGTLHVTGVPITGSGTGIVTPPAEARLNPSDVWPSAANETGLGEPKRRMPAPPVARAPMARRTGEPPPLPNEPPKSATKKEPTRSGS